MTHKTEEYEFARKIVKREDKRPTAYSQNRKVAAVERVAKLEGPKAAYELAREFKI
jgi:hypothetical protein